MICEAVIRSYSMVQPNVWGGGGLTVPHFAVFSQLSCAGGKNLQSSESKLLVCEIASKAEQRMQCWMAHHKVSLSKAKSTGTLCTNLVSSFFLSIISYFFRTCGSGDHPQQYTIVSAPHQLYPVCIFPSMHYPLHHPLPLSTFIASSLIFFLLL